MCDSPHGVLEPALPAPENQLCTSLPNSKFSDIKLVALNQLLGEYTPQKLTNITNQGIFSSGELVYSTPLVPSQTKLLGSKNHLFSLQPAFIPHQVLCPL